MKVKALISFAGIGFGCAKGAVITVPEDIGNDLVKAGYAIPAEENEVKEVKKTTSKKKVAKSEDK